MSKPLKPTRPRREPSLLERAATVYDFQSYVRGPDAAEDPARAVPPFADVAHVAPPPSAGPVEAVPAPAPAADIPPTLSAIPPEFLAGPDDEEFLASEYDPGFSDLARVDRAMLAENGMIVPGAPVGPLAEEFRLVKRQLIVTSQRLVESGDGDVARVVLICSARPQDGKTFCAVNLALSLAAERDTEVLLVDADVAKPDVLGRLGLAEGPGLLDALDDSSIDVEDLVIRTDVPHLSVLPCGTRTASDTELLASVRTRHVLQRLLSANPRRLVIFDSPPALAASPASVLAMLAGQVMMVVRADRTPESDVSAAVALLDACDSIQLVLNSVAFVPGSRRFGYYGHYGQGGARG
ncbi:AAA family ATPase [Sphingomonas sp.]|uniref:AAA family ATPase n=1 Tax=Sphingomonas sp. TaxID=28214 RepID=UPI0031D3F08D